MEFTTMPVPKLVCARQGCRKRLTDNGIGPLPDYCSEACRKRASRTRTKQAEKDADLALRDSWRTPVWLREKVLTAYPVTTDAAALEGAALVPSYYGPDHLDPARRSGLVASWEGVVWINPPFSQLPAWSEKWATEAGRGVVVIALVPNNRMDQPWWSKWVTGRCVLEAIEKRVLFYRPDGTPDPGSPKFGCSLLFYNTTPDAGRPWKRPGQYAR